MKKLMNFLRSMRFGMILLVAVLLLSAVGSIIPQGNEAAYYARNYTSVHQLILKTGADHIFSSWYFVTLLGLLCCNLSLCSLARIGRISRQYRSQAESALAAAPEGEADAEKLASLQRYLDSHGYKKENRDGVLIYTKNRIGYFGSFLTHLAILLIFVVGALVLYLSEVEDQTIKIGESYVLADGTVLTVNDFHIEDETGKLDYASHITVTGADGSSSGDVEIKVNHPYGFGTHKFYQQTYGTCGSITVTDWESGAEDTFYLDEVCFLTADGETGLWYEALYPGYIRDEEGNYTLISSTSGEYADPVYQVLLCADGAMTELLAFPGEELKVGQFIYRFDDPVSYPGIRIKTTPAYITALLYTAFALILLGLYLCFFVSPIALVLRENSYTLYGSKLTGIRLELAPILRSKNEAENENH